MERCRPIPEQTHDQALTRSLRAPFRSHSIRNVTVGVAALCCILVLNAFVSYYNVTRLQEAQSWVRHTLEVRTVLAELLVAVVNAETNARGFAITAEQRYTEDFDSSVSKAGAALTALRKLTSDNADQKRRLDNAEVTIRDKLAWMRNVIRIRSEQGLDSALAQIASGQGVALMEGVRAIIGQMEDEENRLLTLRNAEASRNLTATVTGFVVFAVSTIVLALFIVYLIRRDAFMRERAAQKLQSANRMLQLVLDTVPQRIFWKDRESRFLGSNRLFARDAGVDDVADIIGKTDHAMPWRNSADLYQADDKGVMEADSAKLNYEERQDTPDGRMLWLRTSKVPLHEPGGKVIGLLGTYEDISERKLAEQRLLLQGKAIEASVNGIFISGALDDYPIEYVNSAVEAISGYSATEMLGRNCRFLQAEDRDQEGLAAIRLALREQRPCKVVLRNYRKDGTLFWNDLQIAPVRGNSGHVTHYIGILNDITERVRYQQDLERQANFDSLTGLANRNLVMDRLRGALLRAGQQGEHVAVAMIDLDNFKFVNDSLGHETGDKLLKEIGRRLEWVIGAENTIARYGGDEFVLITGNYRREEELASVLQAVLTTVAHAVKLDDHELFVTCSIGVSVFPVDGTDTTTLLRHADLAMYRAKEGGRNRFELFLPDMTKRVQDRLSLERGLRSALEQGQLLLHYQAQIDLATGRIEGAEALIRWQHPVQGLISPGRFIPVAEDSGLILPIGEWVLRQACLQCKAWHDKGLGPLRISVNLSALQFRQKGFLELVASVLEQTGLAPQFLELEVTESLLMTGTEDALGLLDNFKAQGIELAIDDFGTGYSSLNYLKRLPIDRLKIDQSFVRGLPSDADDVAITRAIISLARAMDLSVIAEGIETIEQRQFLTTSGCDEGQGYYFSRPIPSHEFEELIHKERA